jgi:hypothetical protein
VFSRNPWPFSEQNFNADPNPNGGYPMGTDPTPTPLLINEKQTRILLGMGKQKLFQLTRCHAIPSRKIGKMLRYVPAEISAWVACGCPTEPGSDVRVRKAVKP